MYCTCGATSARRIGALNATAAGADGGGENSNCGGGNGVAGALCAGNAQVRAGFSVGAADSDAECALCGSGGGSPAMIVRCSCKSQLTAELLGASAVAVAGVLGAALCGGNARWAAKHTAG